MPEETRYFTLNGEPPNGGVPPGRLFASIAGPPYTPNAGYYGLPPDHCAPHQAFYPTMHPGPPPPVAPAAPAARASHPSRYDPPGQYVDGRIMRGDDCTIIMPRQLTTIVFLSDGTRPCDYPDGYCPYRFQFTQHKAPSMMTVGDLIEGLGTPPGDHFGIQEVEELGNDRFTSGMPITRGSDLAKMTLAQVGWSAERSKVKPIWLMVKK